MVKKIYFVMLILFSTSVFAASDWVDDFNDCPDNYAAQNCLVAGELVCGYDTDTSTLECSDPSEINAPTATTMSNAGDTYQSEFTGGYIIDCLDYDDTNPYCSNGDGDIYWCNRNSSCYDSPVFRQTNCTGGLWASAASSSVCGSCRSSRYNCYGDTNCETTSGEDCQDGVIPNTRYDLGTCDDATGGGTCECDPAHFECDGGIEDGDGCEWGTDDSCGSTTGYIQNEECISAAQANCTAHGARADNRDCDDSDSDANEITCNSGNGCEITLFVDTNNSHSIYQTCNSFACESTWNDCNGPGTGADPDGCEIQDGDSCTVGGASGTYSGCSCVVPPINITTGGWANGLAQEYYTQANESLIFLVDWGVGNLLTLNGTFNQTIQVNQSGHLRLESIGECSQCLEVDSNGWLYCGTDETGGGGGSQWPIETRDFINNSDTLELNWTSINNTIDLRENDTIYTFDNDSNIFDYNVTWFWNHVVNGTMALNSTFSSFIETESDPLYTSGILDYWNMSLGNVGFNNLTKCADDQIMKSNGSDWNCEADFGGTSVWSQDATHTEIQSAPYDVKMVGNSKLEWTDGTIIENPSTGGLILYI